MVFDAIRRDSFYVFPHPWIEEAVRARTECMVAGGVPAPPVEAEGRRLWLDPDAD